MRYEEEKAQKRVREMVYRLEEETGSLEYGDVKKWVVIDGERDRRAIAEGLWRLVESLVNDVDGGMSRLYGRISSGVKLAEVEN